MRFRILIVIWVALAVGLPIRAEALSPEQLVVCDADSTTDWWAVMPSLVTAELLCGGFTAHAPIATIPSHVELNSAVQPTARGPAQTLQTQHQRLQV